MTKTAVAVGWEDYQHHHQFHIHWNIGDDAVYNTYSTTTMMMDPLRNNYNHWVAVVASTVSVHDDPLFVAYSQLQPFDHDVVDQSFFFLSSSIRWMILTTIAAAAQSQILLRHHFSLSSSQHQAKVTVIMMGGGATMTIDALSHNKIMKTMISSAIVVIASLLSSADAATCQICDGAEDYREDLLAPSPEFFGFPGLEMKCKDVVLMSTEIDEFSEDCPNFRYFEAFCCPSVASSCSICQGVQLVFSDLEIPDSDGVTCGLAAFLAAQYNVTSQECTDMHMLESLCCPCGDDPLNSDSTSAQSSDNGEKTPSSACKFCVDKEVLEDVEIPGFDGETCGSFALGASTFEDTSEECSGIETVELVCCPEPSITVPTGSPPSNTAAALRLSTLNVVASTISVALWLWLLTSPLLFEKSVVCITAAPKGTL